MENSLFPSALVLLMILNSVTLSSSQTFFNSTTDQYALLAFKNAIISDPRGVMSKNWSTETSICYWTGVFCSIKHQRVKALNVSGFELGGTIVPHLGNLTFLQSLDISFNNFKGLIPSELSNLRRLKEINVGFNNIEGEIPPWFGALSKLQHMHLNNNTFFGSLPPSLFHISKLQTLNMGYNLLDGNLPKEISNFSYLEVVNLVGNQITGSLPTGVFNMPSLIEINMRSNKLSGKLPADICGNATSKLKRIYLSGNQLYGEIPRNIYKCRELEDLRLPFNHFNGNIPSEIGRLTMLTRLSLYSNDFKGHIPKQVGNLTYLEGLYLSDNNFIAIILGIIILMLIRRRKHENIQVPTDISLGEWRRISYFELVRGTSSFNETTLLGRGSFGSVFKAILSDGLNVAIKVFDLQLERAAKSFDSECAILRTVRHRNLVRVIGCCANPEFKALILEYMTNGSLDKWLYSEKCCLDLLQRLKIAIDVALALQYLHHGHTFPIVHCDIKPSNVLLDEDMVAHVGDFGIAKLFDKGEAMIQTKSLATVGYAAPEYGSEGKISTSADVYSYGIMLLEMFTRKKPTDDMFSGEMSLKEWVGEALHENAITEVVDPSLVAREDKHFSGKEQCVSSIFDLAMKCLAISPKERINMIEAAATLQKIKDSYDRHQKASIMCESHYQ